MPGFQKFAEKGEAPCPGGLGGSATWQVSRDTGPQPSRGLSMIVTPKGTVTVAVTVTDKGCLF